MSTIWGFDHIECKHTLHRGKHYEKKFCTSLREYAKTIIRFENKRRIKITSRSKIIYVETL